MTAAVGPPRPARAVLSAFRSAFVSAAAFSSVINLLMLSGALFMLQVYDRVLPSRSLDTLAALCVLIAVLYGFQGVLELLRSRIFARIGRNADERLGALVFHSALRRNQYASAAGAATFRDLEQLRSFLSGAGPTTFFDLPWLPIYLILMTLLHPLLGLLGLLGAAILAALTWRANVTTGPLQRESAQAASEALFLAEQARRNAETVLPMGMAGALAQRWGARNLATGLAVLKGSDIAGSYSALSRFFRMTLQSATLAAGAWLIIEGRASGGVMIAASILLGRALAPVELAIAHWRGFVAARQAFERLDSMLAGSPAEAVRLALPPPTASLAVSHASVAAPQTAPGPPNLLLRDISFALAAGDGLAVIGPSGAGKSTLMRTLVGLHRPLAGAVTLDGSILDQWTNADAGRFIGYLPQTVELFGGTIAENIARFDPQPDAAAILRAAEAAGVDQLVRALPDGFETEVGEAGSRLSAGQRQRIALARALYGEPFLVVLDEPNSALDAEGEAALSRAMTAARQRGAVVIAAVHRTSGLQALNKVLILQAGAQTAFGPVEEVLRKAAAAAGGRFEVVSS